MDEHNDIQADKRIIGLAARRGKHGDAGDGTAVLMQQMWGGVVWYA